MNLLQGKSGTCLRGNAIKYKLQGKADSDQQVHYQLINYDELPAEPKDAFNQYTAREAFRRFMPKILKSRRVIIVMGYNYLWRDNEELNYRREQSICYVSLL